MPHDLDLPRDVSGEIYDAIAAVVVAEPGPDRLRRIEDLRWAVVRNTDTYLVWSNEHRRWWGRLDGYTPSLGDARVMSHDEALRTCVNAIPGTASRMGMLPELPVRLIDLLTIRDGFDARYGGLMEPWK